MALVNQEVGAIEYGAGSFTGLAATTALVLAPPQAPGVDNRNGGNYPVLAAWTERDRQSMAILVNVACNGTFNLDYQFTPDNGTTWYVGSQIASTTVTVDGGAAGFTQAAQLNLQVGYQYRVQLYNTSGGNLNGAYEWRLYTDN